MVTAALTLALGAYSLTILHRLETFEPKFNRTDYSHIVVAGAWRLPNKTLSATFARRVDRGDELAQQFNATLVFTGGLGDSRAAKNTARTAARPSTRTSRARRCRTPSRRRASRPMRHRFSWSRRRTIWDGVSSISRELSRLVLWTSPPHYRIRGMTGAAAASSRASTGRKTCVAWACRTRARLENPARGPRTSFKATSFVLRGDAVDFLKRLDLKKKGVT